MRYDLGNNVMIQNTRIGGNAVRFSVCLTVLVLTITVAGCSDNKPLTVNGSVSYKGQRIPAGIVKFYGPENHSSMAYVRDGTFIVTDLPPGEYKASVESDDSEKKGLDKAQGGKPLKIPSKYNDPKTSGLVFTLTGSTREIPIDLD